MGRAPRCSSTCGAIPLSDANILLYMSMFVYEYTMKSRKLRSCGGKRGDTTGVADQPGALSAPVGREGRAFAGSSVEARASRQRPPRHAQEGSRRTRSASHRPPQERTLVMPSTNGHGPKRAILYARVSTDEQARSGYSLAQQLEALREYAAREGYEVLEEVLDPGQSGASLERPGMDRVRDLVASGGVSLVLARDRDRFAREPAYLFYLREEFGERQTTLRALNDHGDGTPEGELTTGILDQIARYERLKIAERSRRGKLRKAREGKVIATKRSHYGFRYNTSRDGYEVDEETMAVVKRIFRMVGTEGAAIRAVKRAFELEGLPTPQGKDIWGQLFIRMAIRDDTYRPHSHEEIQRLVAKGQMSAEVASRLDPEKCYGIWWFNRRRTKTYQEAVNGPDGKRYKRRVKITPRPEEEWIAVPVPDSGIPREWIDLAREAIKDNVKFSQNHNRPWVLSGGVARCAECGWALTTHTVRGAKSKHVNYYYRCSRAQVHYAYESKNCVNSKHHRADRLEPMVWNYVSRVMKNPTELRSYLHRMS